jgi:N-dimethylarginine dimethylaminohydrolase
MSRLSWGQRILMCRPDYFGVLYEINPWMHAEVKVDPDLARAQWEELVRIFEAAGCSVELEAPVEGLPDLVFTANAGVVSAGRFVPARFRFPERQPESRVDAAHLRAAGYEVLELPEGICHEGAGDALPFAGVLLSGYRIRSDLAAHEPLGSLLDATVRSVELVDSRLYHLDLVFCPLDARRALVAPLGFDHYGLTLIEHLVPEPVYLDDEEALAFCANSVVVGDTIVMPSCSPALGRRLESFGLEVVVASVGEFQKAGGAVRCLTLALDVDLGRAS